ncbi:MAG TPA: hypothetical protein VL346_05220 [Acidobacteriaceae bacterium]|nr:hypothetical protein [Acidobacteriaceae bacterium]
MAETVERKHSYHAEAHALSGNIILPLEQNITPHALTSVPEDGGYRAQQAQQYRLETVISYGRAHTQVSGHKELKPGRGYLTLATSVIEDVNILNIVTADRVVAQIATEHPLQGYVPRITFLGTHFHNLRIAGHIVELDLDTDIVGEKPENDLPYTKDAGFVDRISRQHARLREHPNVFQEILDRYNRVPESFGSPEGGREIVECSLVRQAKGSYPGKTCGHVIHLKDFGKIYLAMVTVEHEDYEHGIPKKTTVSLEMIRAEMGCIATGKAGVGSAKTNGVTRP